MKTTQHIAKQLNFRLGLPKHIGALTPRCYILCFFHFQELNFFVAKWPLTCIGLEKAPDQNMQQIVA